MKNFFQKTPWYVLASIAWFLGLVVGLAIAEPLLALILGVFMVSVLSVVTILHYIIDGD